MKILVCFLSLALIGCAVVTRYDFGPAALDDPISVKAINAVTKGDEVIRFAHEAVVANTANWKSLRDFVTIVVTDQAYYELTWHALAGKYFVEYRVPFDAILSVDEWKPNKVHGVVIQLESSMRAVSVMNWTGIHDKKAADKLFQILKNEI